MDINAISKVNMPAQNVFNQSKTAENIPLKKEKSELSQKSKLSKALPYVGAAVVIAGLGVAFRGKISRLFKKGVKNAEDLKNIADKTNQEQKVQVLIHETGEEAAKIPDSICIGFEDGKAIYAKTEKVSAETLTPVKSHYDELLTQGKNSLNEEVTAVIVKNREKQSSEIIKLISDATDAKGNVDFEKLHQASRDAARNEALTGSDRFHQAADILEQAYISKFVKGDKKTKEGLQNVFDFTVQQSPLYEIYAHMEPQDVLGRLKYLAENDLKSASYKGMSAEQFTDKAFERYVEKHQFQKYNKARNIKDTLLFD